MDDNPSKKIRSHQSKQTKTNKPTSGGEEEALPCSRIPMSKCRRNDRNPQCLANTTVITVRQELSRDVTMRGEVMRRGILTWSWSIPPQNTYYKAKAQPYWEKAGRYHLSNGSRSTSAVTGQSHVRCPLLTSCTEHWEGHNVTSVVFLPQTHNLDLIKRKHHKQKLRALDKRAGQTLFKSVKVMKDKETEELFKLKGD